MDKDAGEQIACNQTFFRRSLLFTWTIQGWQRPSVFLQCPRMSRPKKNDRERDMSYRRTAVPPAHDETSNSTIAFSLSGGGETASCGQRVVLLGRAGFKDGFAVVRGVEGGRDKSVMDVDDTVVGDDDRGPTPMADGCKTAFARWLRFFQNRGLAIVTKKRQLAFLHGFLGFSGAGKNCGCGFADHPLLIRVALGLNRRGASREPDRSAECSPRHCQIDGAYVSSCCPNHTNRAIVSWPEKIGS